MRLFFFGAALLAGMCHGPRAVAQDEMSTEAARRLGEQGVELFQRGEYAEASDKLDRAYQVVRVPTLGLWSARALEKAGRLVAAAERYRAVVRHSVKPDDPDVFRAAQADARAEGDALAKRIPQLTVQVTGADAGSVSVKVDGKAIAAALVGVPISVDPGTRAVEGLHGDKTVRQSVQISEGAARTVTLAFTGEGAVSEASPAGSPAVAGATASPADFGTEPSDGSTQRLLGWVSIGIGGAGLIAGSVIGVMALSKQGELDDNCPNGQCEPEFHGDVDSFESLRLVSGIGLGVGIVGIAAGTVLLLTAPSSAPNDASVRPWIGLGGAGVSGRY